MFLRTLLASALALTAGAASAQTTAAGPYYATPSWDQTMDTSTRFVTLSNWHNAVILDRETGLVWEANFPDDPAGSQTYAQAFSGCWSRGYGTTANGGTRGAFRLPSMPELLSLIDTDRGTFPPVPPGAPFTGKNEGLTLWTSTTYAGDSSRHAVLIYGAHPPGTDFENNSALHASLCVRGPGGGEQ